MIDNLLTDAEVGPLDARIEAKLERLAALVREGAAGHLSVDGRDYWLHRLPGGAWRLRGEKDAAPAKDGSWGPPLWRLLEANAPTPEARRALAVGMSAKIPCGSCRQHWSAALAGLTAEHCATAEAFARWVGERHNEISRRLGKPEWPLP